MSSTAVKSLRKNQNKKNEMAGACGTCAENKTNKSTQHVKTVQRIYDHLATFTGTNICGHAFRKFETATTGPRVKPDARCYIGRSE
jgi:cobyrinic acid a,c-diamide synthase